MNAVNRFGPFGVRVACLTRFRTKEEVQSILAGVASGSIGLVIGTHRILSKDVNFYDLGLLVLDAGAVKLLSLSFPCTEI